MIKVEIIKDMAVTLVYCDGCGERIEKASEGIVVYDPETGTVKFYHKSYIKPACDLHRDFPWMALNAFLYYLMYNLNVDYEVAKKSAALFREAFTGLGE